MDIELFSDERGELCVGNVPNDFLVKRVFWINAPKGVTRGKHGHHFNQIILILQTGSIVVRSKLQNEDKEIIKLSEIGSSLMIPNKVWHEIEFLEDSIVLCLNSHLYDEEDYFFDRYSV